MKRNLKIEVFKNKELKYDLCIAREKLDLSEMHQSQTKRMMEFPSYQAK